MNKTKIELKGLAFFARHGVLEEEATMGQRFRLDVLLQLVDGLAFGTDETSCTVNYAEVYDSVKESFMGQRFNLIEAAAEAVAVDILSKFEKVEEATVKVIKPSAPVDCVCDYFAVEISRCR